MNTKLIGLALLFIVFGLSMAGFFGQATTNEKLSASPAKSFPTPESLPVYTATGILNTITRIINWIFTLLMLVVIVMVLVAGYFFVTGGGNPDQIGKARQILIYAMIGFAVAMISRGIIALVGVVLEQQIDMKTEWK